MRVIAPTSDEQWRAYLACRYRNLYVPFGLPESCTTSELDTPRDRAGVLHRMVVVDRDGQEEVAAVGRLDLQPGHAAGPSAQLRYFAVDVPHRGSGAGQALMLHMEAQARSAGCVRLWMEARTIAANFYARLGYADIGEGPTKWGVIPHRLMAKVL